MSGVRIRWKGVAKGGAIALGALLALLLLPALLRPPEPPPLDPDVGLPRVEVEPEALAKPAGEGAPTTAVARPEERPRRHPMLQAKVGAGPTPRARSARKKARPQPAPASTPAPAPAAAPPPEPEPEPAPAPVGPMPPPPPPPPSDGSEEFAPH